MNRFIFSLTTYIFAVIAFGQNFFTKITTGEVVNITGDKEGVAWADFNNDGFDDLYFSNASTNSSSTNYLLKNNGDGTFTRITSGNIVTDNNIAFASSWGDYDNDGNIDCYSSNFGNSAITTTGAMNSLYRNNGDETFTKRYYSSVGDITGDVAFTSGTTWGDYDNDGYLDMFVSNFSVYEYDFLYHNDGDGTFTRIMDMNNAITSDLGLHPSNSASWVDVDMDNDLDLFVAKRGKNDLYINVDGINFTKITDIPIVADLKNHYGSSWADYDNDGDLDVFITTFVYFYGENNNDFNKNLLFRNDGGGIFTKITNSTNRVVQDMTRSIGSTWGDFDNDGDQDLFVSNFFNDDNLLYINDGGGNFTKITSGSIVNDDGRSTGCAAADYDNDGDLDLTVANYGSNFLYRNDLSGTNKFVEIKCIGNNNYNTSAIGTKVFITANINGTTVRQMREISAQSGYSGQNSLRAHFGLGNAQKIDELEIRWPNGQQCFYLDIPVNCFITAKEYCSLSLDYFVYCKSYGQNTTYEWIDKVELGSISNQSGNNNGYRNYKHISTDLTRNFNHCITLTPGFGSSGADYEAWIVFIDFNQNGQYESSEQVLYQFSDQVIFDQISIPSTALLGKTGMRIMMKYSLYGNTDPCEEAFVYGEVEDYIVNITDYCTSAATKPPPQEEWIQRVKIENILSASGQIVNEVLIDNMSGSNGGYVNFSGLSVLLTRNAVYKISVTPGFLNNLSFNEYFRMFLDFNHDGDFLDPLENLGIARASNTVNRLFTIPSDALLGSTKLRIVMRYDADPLSGGTTFTYGEVEDYIVNISDPINAKIQQQVEEVIILSENEKINPSLILFPNPSQGSFTLQTSNEINEILQSGSIIVYNLLGEIVLELNNEQLINDRYWIDMSNKAAGTYYVKLFNSNKSMSAKLVLIK